MTTLATQQLNNATVIGLRNGQPVTAIVTQIGRSRPQLVGGILYIPTPAVVRLVNGDVVIDN